MATFEKLLKEVKNQINEITAEAVDDQVKQHAPVTLIDVREADEWEGGIINGALTIPRGFLELNIERELPDKNQPIVVYCAGGVRSALAAKALKDLGYKKVSSLIGGFTGWKRSGYPFSMKRGLSSDQQVRYSRHLLLPEVGEAGQLKLMESKALVIGAGGLGSPTSLYLAAAGVGTIGINDFDIVDLSNLQRQIVHNEGEIGHSKVQSAIKTIEGINSSTKLIPHEQRLTRDNIMDVIKDYDIVINGCDNFPTRYLVNDACVFARKPMVDGSIFRFEGQVTVFHPATGGPCYRCLYPEPPPPDMAPSCAEAGVLGALCGIIGSLQTIEALKVLLGVGEPLVGRLLMYDALKQHFRELKVRRDKNCPVCGDSPTITELIDYEGFCAIP